ncbi:dentin sialophosphoprotein-like isoform X2 [Lethenteron reissneri]|nr:dentin sialophosphoprotein-like isoform X2 [Lethenteron reissneri]XP_061420034.1 dentin sialophosphoprotein-like isoform X2 [Lethenteron reissneri]
MHLVPLPPPAAAAAVLILLFLALETRAAPVPPACPLHCTCAPSPAAADVLAVNCSGVGLSSTSSSLAGIDAAAVGTLDLSRNGVARVDLALLGGLAGFEVLHLGGNGVVELRSGSRGGWRLTPWGRGVSGGGGGGGGQLLKNLKVLLLNDNKLDNIPAVIRELTSLERLSLAHNEIVTVRSDALHTLSSLRHLELQGNRISHVEGGAFRGLSALTELNLGDNSLSTLTPDPLADLEDAIGRASLSLDLRGNPWRCDCRASALLGWARQSQARARLLREVTCWGRPAGRSLLAAEEDCGRPGASVIAAEGTTAVLPCGPEEAMEVLYWRTPLGPVDGERDGDGGRPHVDRSGALVVPHASVEHEGRYECVRWSGAARDLAPVHLLLSERGHRRARSAAGEPRAACAVSQEQFVLAVSLSVIITFLGAFALGVLARPYVMPLFSCCSRKPKEGRATDRSAAARDNPAFSDDGVQGRPTGDGRKGAGRKKGVWLFGRRKNEIAEPKVKFYSEPPGAMLHREGKAKVSRASSSSNSSQGPYRDTHLPGMGMGAGGRRDIDSTDSAIGSSQTTYENVQLNAHGHAKPQKPDSDSDSDTSSSHNSFVNVNVQPLGHINPGRGVGQPGHLSQVSGGMGVSHGGNRVPTAKLSSPKRLAPLPPANVSQTKSPALQLPSKENSGAIAGAVSVAVLGKPSEVGALKRWPESERYNDQLQEEQHNKPQSMIPKKPPRREHSDSTSDSESDEGKNVVPGRAHSGMMRPDKAKDLEEISLSSNYVVHIDGVDTGETECDAHIDSPVAHGSSQKNVGQTGGQDASQTQGMHAAQPARRSSSSSDDSSDTDDGNGGVALPGGKAPVVAPRYVLQRSSEGGEFPPKSAAAAQGKLGPQASDAAAAGQSTPSKRFTFAKLKAAMNLKVMLPTSKKEKGKDKSKAEAQKKESVESQSSGDSSLEDGDNKPKTATVKVDVEDGKQSSPSSSNASEQSNDRAKDLESTLRAPVAQHGPQGVSLAVKAHLGKGDSQSLSDSSESDDDRRASHLGDGTAKGSLISGHAKWPTTQSLHRLGRGEDSEEDASPGTSSMDGRVASSLQVASILGQERQTRDDSHSDSSDGGQAASSLQLAASRGSEGPTLHNSHSDSSDDGQAASSLQLAASRGPEGPTLHNSHSDSSDDGQAASSPQLAASRGSEGPTLHNSHSDSSDGGQAASSLQAVVTRGQERQSHKESSSDSSDARQATGSLQPARSRGRERQRWGNSQSDSSDDGERPPRGRTGPPRGDTEGSRHRQDDEHEVSPSPRSNLLANTLAAWPTKKPDILGTRRGQPRVSVSSTSSDDESVERPVPQKQQQQQRATVTPTATRNVSATHELHTQWGYSTKVDFDGGGALGGATKAAPFESSWTVSSFLTQGRDEGASDPTGVAQPHVTLQTENAFGFSEALSSALLMAPKAGEKSGVFSSDALLSLTKRTGRRGSDDSSSSSSSSGDEQLRSTRARAAKPDLLSPPPPPLPNAPPPGDEIDRGDNDDDHDGGGAGDQDFEFVSLPKLSVSLRLPGSQSDSSTEEFISRQLTAGSSSSLSDGDLG